jgi:hypothetical protein
VPFGFARPVFVDPQLAGGEPAVMHPSKFAPGRLIYTAHEGTTHLYRPGLATAPVGDSDYVANYRNQVNVWTSDDNGVLWQRVNWNGTGFFNSPLNNTGFSDPDLTEDAGGRIYDTGIDLANDALFSSTDGGTSWPTGTVQCHEGDRPWLAGGKKDEVFLATDSGRTGHTLYHSSDGGTSCDSGYAIVDNGTLKDGTTYSGFGKLQYNKLNGDIVEPVTFQHPDGSLGLGIGVLTSGAKAFRDIEGIHPVTNIGLFLPTLAIDAAGTVYLEWATDPRQPNTNGGCSSQVPNQIGGPFGTKSPLANSLMLAYTADEGRTWGTPITIAHPGTTVLWPWAVGGAGGNVGIVWYQYDRVTDPDCGQGNVSVMAAEVLDATSPHRSISITDAVGRPVHAGGICQSGTTCVATGQDRRLGDYFTDNLDSRGCLIIATGDTSTVDVVTGGSNPTSRALFARQNSGPSLTTGQDCSAPVGAVSAATPGAPAETGAAKEAQPPATAGMTGLANTSAGSAGISAVLLPLAIGPGALWLRRRRGGRPQCLREG